MYKAICDYCNEWEYESGDQDKAKEKLGEHFLKEHTDELRKIPKEGGRSSTGLNIKGSKCKSGDGHRIKEDLTPDLKCPICGEDYSKYIANSRASWMIEEVE